MSQEPFTNENPRSKLAYLSHSQNGGHPTATTEETGQRDRNPSGAQVTNKQEYRGTHSTITSSRRGRKRRTWRCYICDDSHHYAKDCPFLQMARQIVKLEMSKGSQPGEEKHEPEEHVVLTGDGNPQAEEGTRVPQEVVETNMKFNDSDEAEEEETARTEDEKETRDVFITYNLTPKYTREQSKEATSHDMLKASGYVIATDLESEEETNSQQRNNESDRHTETANAKKEKKTNKKEKSRVPKNSSFLRKKANPNLNEREIQRQRKPNTELNEQERMSSILSIADERNQETDKTATKQRVQHVTPCYGYKREETILHGEWHSGWAKWNHSPLWRSRICQREAGLDVFTMMSTCEEGVRSN
eukprot:GILK01004426.1.p2 GENE.GILK01004426.1~~GILK01004426.1.p2  ORF type:complete len:360 (+),score=49.80 GILK01004426.1:1952-3031(+)